MKKILENKSYPIYPIYTLRLKKAFLEVNRKIKCKLFLW